MILINEFSFLPTPPSVMLNISVYITIIKNIIAIMTDKMLLTAGFKPALVSIRLQRLKILGKSRNAFLMIQLIPLMKVLTI